MNNQMWNDKIRRRKEKYKLLKLNSLRDGLCIHCRKKPLKSQTYCEDCLIKFKKYNKNRKPIYIKNKLLEEKQEGIQIVVKHNLENYVDKKL